MTPNKTENVPESTDESETPDLDMQLEPMGPVPRAKQSASRTAVLVLGMHRSGTSAVTRVLSMCGATLPANLMEMTGRNPRGYFASQRIMELHDALLAEAWRTALPGRVLQVIAPGAVLPDGHPAQYKEQVEGLATAYVCVGSFCSLPQWEPAEFAAAMKLVRRTSKVGMPAPVQ